MQRLALSLSSVLVLTASAAAQPAPDPQTQPPQPPPGEPAAAPQPDPVPAVEPPPPPPKKEEPPLAKKLGVGTLSPGSFFTPGLNVQGWFVYDHTTKAGAMGEDDIQSSASFFRLRRVELTLGGEIIPKAVKYRVMFDPARISEARTTTSVTGAAGTPVNITTPNGPFSPLQDAYVTFSGQYADVLIGQFKNPVSWDGFNSAAKLMLPDRAFATGRFNQRDVGVRVEKVFKKFAYYGGVFNGSGQNTVADTNNQKDVALRLEIFPIPGLTIAGVTYDSVGYRTKAGTKDRWEGDLRYEANGILFQGEFIRARDVLADDADPVNQQAFYAALGYTIKGVGAGAWKGDIQPVVRVGYNDPDADDKATPSAANIARIDYEAGINYYLRGHEVKFQLAYDRQQYDDSDLRRAVDEVILATQVWY